MKLTVIGLGYVGLPVACAFAKAGITVFGVDKNPKLLTCLKQKQYSYTEPGLNEILDEVLEKTLFVSEQAGESDVYIVTVQTPINEKHISDNSFVEKALKDIAPFVKQGNLVILESTVSVGANKRFYELLRSQVPSDVEFFYCYCPETILPGNIFHEIAVNSRVLGGNTPMDAQRAKELYDRINTGRKEVTDIATAEFVKLIQNAHRDVELAFVNQLSVMCDREEVDVFRVIEIANHHPRCHLLQPGSGVGGHCIAVDPYFLMERFGEEASLIKVSRDINNHRPFYIADKVIKMLENDTQKTIGVLGLSYKPDCEDYRESSGIAICRYLQKQGYRVLANEVNSYQKMIFEIPNRNVQ